MSVLPSADRAPKTCEVDAALLGEGGGCKASRGIPESLLGEGGGSMAMSGIAGTIAMDVGPWAGMLLKVRSWAERAPRASKDIDVSSTSLARPSISSLLGKTSGRVPSRRSCSNCRETSSRLTFLRDEKDTDCADIFDLPRDERLEVLDMRAERILCRLLLVLCGSSSYARLAVM